MSRKERAIKKSLRQQENKWRELKGKEIAKGYPGGGRYLKKCDERLDNARKETLKFKSTLSKNNKEVVIV